ncbi:hypothetical protein CDD83_6448 [Cordyceps sp. RAO-2017]|nr:hypothetical protein CDD83_6448 [Cordyceps sp. RAO-2017]
MGRSGDAVQPSVHHSKLRDRADDRHSVSNCLRSHTKQSRSTCSSADMRRLCHDRRHTFVVAACTTAARTKPRRSFMAS